MKKEAIKEQVVKIIREKYLQDIYVGEDNDLLELGIGSIKIIELVVDLELEFEFEFADEKLSYDTLHCINNIVSYIYEEKRKEYDNC